MELGTVKSTFAMYHYVVYSVAVNILVLALVSLSFKCNFCNNPYRVYFEEWKVSLLLTESINTPNTYTCSCLSSKSCKYFSLKVSAEMAML